ncbi:teichoic acid transport system ATP-binding protein [Scopulibacillus darangshiensis]|uniref:Teichoic acid transport system ATP-binding protein n=1 Tax=Scopulibacillus darangshiensis TaxID=442528 RepID=A0A4R2P856_9BACL|nr:teichoic acid transport system ATP-binding protein [Scopulibacillus darangshiensis]
MSSKVSFKAVTKTFKMYNRSVDRVKDMVRFREKGNEHYALRNVSFDVDEGEIVGVIGLNGAGKSTLSNLISGITMPSSGEAKVNGHAALIAISSGLNMKLTGLENIELKGLMLGLNKKKIKEITPKVIEFADIGKFIGQPVKTYSSGMKARLGFAISVHIDPDILVIDEALSVGDQTFTDKCIAKMAEFKEKGKTIFFISHSISQVRDFCNKVLWLHYGQVKEYGSSDEVINHYLTFLKEYNSQSADKKRAIREKESKLRDADDFGQRQYKALNVQKMLFAKKGLGFGLLCCTLVISGFLSIAQPTLSFNQMKSFFAEKVLMLEHHTDKEE